jgi:hypothetical protein
LGDLKPDHWTICNFRKENKDLIHWAALEFRKFLIANGYIEGKRVIFDGSKMKAYAAREMFCEKSLNARITKIEEQLNKYLDNSDQTDELEDRLEAESKENETLKAKIKKLEEEKAKLGNLKDKLEKSGKNHISPTDPDASLMKSRDGKMPCYNIQTAVDAKHHMIAMAEATTDNNDMGLLKADFENIKTQIGLNPNSVEADKGYANIDQIKEIEESSLTKCIVPLQEVNSKEQDHSNGIAFVYDQENNQYTCSNDKKLRLLQTNYKHRNQLYNIYKCSDCATCPIKKKCTTSKSGRSIKVNIHHQWIREYKQRIEQPENREKIKQRKTIVEHPYGTIKMIMGKFCFLLRSKYKVQIEVDLYSTVYNLKRLINIENMQDLFKKIEKYNWKVA